MSFRTRLLLSFAVTVGITVTLVTWIASARTRSAFEERDNQRTAALIAQFRSEFARRGGEIAQAVEGIAAADDTLRIAIGVNRPNADIAPYVNEAGSLAATHGLDFLELISEEGVIVSSAQWPARFGYRVPWTTEPVDWNGQGAFLRAEELPDETALALIAVRTVSAGDRKLFIAGGRRLDHNFLATIVLPAGVRALLYRNLDAGFSPAALMDGSGSAVAGAASLAPLINEVRALGRETTKTIRTAAGPETFQASPLTGRSGDLLGVLLVGSSRRDLAALTASIRAIGLTAAGIGMLLALLMSVLAARRITRPVEQLAAGALEVSKGNWDARVEVSEGGELGRLAEAFNLMTRQLIEQRDRLVQTERVAAWRELARRLAHELKNPLFPIQITLENLQRAKECAPDQFDEIFNESAETLLAELENLKRIIGRFSDFAKMPAPQLEQVDVNEIVMRTVKVFDAQLAAANVKPEVLCGEAGVIRADPEQLGRALRNLILNAIDAMPDGGTLRISTARRDGIVELELSDTGQGLTEEECARLFTPYYTTKQHGTGLGLAIVQSVVADHKGRISVASAPGGGATFRIELPAGI